MVSLKLSLEDIRNNFSDTIFERGRSYQTKGAVSNVQLRDAVLSADIEGSEYQPYKVRIRFKNNRIDEAICSCPYDESFMGYCKHIAATLLQCHYEPKSISEAEGIASILKPLKAKELRGALDYLLELYPEAVDRLELYLKKSNLINSTTQTQKTNKTKSALKSVSIDTRLYEKLMRSAVASSGVDWDGYPDHSEVYPVIKELEAFLTSSAYPETIILTETLIQTFVDGVNKSEINEYDNIGFCDENIFSEFDTYLVEAIYGATLTDSLTDDDRKHLLSKILEWHDEATNEWTDPNLNMSAYALIETFENLDDQAEDLIHEVTKYSMYDSSTQLKKEIHLKVMRNTGNLETALKFAHDTRQGADYLLILCEQNKLEQVMDEYKTYLDDDFGTRRVVEYLANKHPTEALEIASYGLAQDTSDEKSGNPLGFANPHRLELATTSKELAKSLNSHTIHLDASIIEFQYGPNLNRYIELKALATSDWKHIRKTLLQGLRKQRFGSGQREAAVDIFINESLFEDAITLVSKSHTSEALVKKVMSAVIDTHPEWVKDYAQEEARKVMDAAKAKYYYQAVEWLEHSKATYVAHNQKAEWKAYLLSIRSKHGKKRKLMGLIQHL